MKKILRGIALLPVLVFSQQSFLLELRPSGREEMLNKLSYKKSFSSQQEREKEIRNVFFYLYANGYLAASADSSQEDSLMKIVFISAGAQYEWAFLRRGNAEYDILSENGFRESFFAHQPFHYKEVRQLQEKILTYCENNGYPFASIQLDSILIAGKNISASLNLQKNNLIKIDSIVNRGSAKISDAYLQSYLGIRPGDLYNESRVKQIGTRIRELPFVKEKIPFRFLFSPTAAKIELFLEKKRASQFDGVAGILPDNKTGKILLTGDVRLKLNNSLNRGELLEVNWRRLQTQTQDLKTRFVFPFLFRTPFGADANFKLYKKDSAYLEINPNLGIQYALEGNNYFKAFVNRRQFSLLSTKGLENLTQLPNYADVTSTLYGIGVKMEKLDYRLNPRKGYSVLVSAGAGNKIISRNDKLNPEIYDGLKLKTVQYSAELEAEIFFPLKKNSAFKIGNRSAYLFNENLFLNELFRLGGLKTLRGFDEESVFASAYSILTVEYRFLFEENSYLFFFSEGAYYENRSIIFTGDRYDTPIGFGAGISFETKAGIFSINYALGKQFDNPFDLKTGKVHFGIVNYF